jgi:FAD/FMN-containing dehydrogenase
VNIGRDAALEIAVRCGGHSASGQSVGDGLVVDLSGLKAIDIDPDAKIARAGGGVLWGEFDQATQANGFHTRPTSTSRPRTTASVPPTAMRSTSDWSR